MNERLVLFATAFGIATLISCSDPDQGIASTGGGATAGTGGVAGTGGGAGNAGEGGRGGANGSDAGAGAAGSGGMAGSPRPDGGTAGAAGTSGGAGGSGGSGGGAAGSDAGGAGGAGGGGAGGAGAGAGGTAGSADAGGTGGAPPGDTMGCGNTKLYMLPEDTGTRGPWPVGARTMTVEGLLTEVWYPATRGSEAGQTKVVYDIRKWLPASEQMKIPDVDNPWQPCDCYRDLPLDTAHGPYPVVIFLHGTAAWRAQSVQLVQHWASRGFVVASSDHPGLFLADYLDFRLGAMLPADTDKLLAALRSPTGDLQFLASHIDMNLLGMVGHSAGGGAITGYGNQAQVLIPLASGGVSPGTALKSTLVMGGQVDTVARYTGQQTGYASSPARKRLVGIKNAGHLAFSDICAVGADKGGLLAIAQKYMVRNANLAGFLFDCSATQLAPEKGWPIVNRSTSAVLEETLHCSTTAAKSFDTVKADPDVGEYQEQL